MKRTQAKLTLKDVPVREALAQIELVVKTLENHPDYARTRSTIVAARELLDATVQAANEADQYRVSVRTAITKRNVLYKTLCEKARYLVYGVQSVSEGNRTAILSAGLQPVRERRPLGLPPAPTHLRIRSGTHAGTVVFRWKRIGQRCLYVVQMTTDPSDEASWRKVDEPLRVSCVLKNLKPGELYSFRVAAKNTHGLGPWSNAVSARAA